MRPTETSVGRPLLQCGPLKRAWPATAWPKPQGHCRVPPAPALTPLQPEGLCEIVFQAPVGSAFKILIQSILVTYSKICHRNHSSAQLEGIKSVHSAVTTVTTSISRTFSSSQTDTLSPSNTLSPSLRPHRPLPVSGFDCSGASHGWNSNGLCPLHLAFGQHHVLKAHLWGLCQDPLPF